jgi:hypothetical protein
MLVCSANIGEAELIYVGEVGGLLVINCDKTCIPNPPSSSCESKLSSEVDDCMMSSWWSQKDTVHRDLDTVRGSRAELSS